MILIVDDDPAVLEMAREILNRKRQVFFASNAQQVFKLAQDIGFSVVLVDLDLGGEDGLGLILEISNRFPGLPVIAISASPREAVLELAREFGAVEFLQKPVTPEWKSVVERVRALRARA